MVGHSYLHNNQNLKSNTALSRFHSTSSHPSILSNHQITKTLFLIFVPPVFRFSFSPLQNMASLCTFPRISSTEPIKQTPAAAPFPPSNQPMRPSALSLRQSSSKHRRISTVVAAIGDVSADGTTYLIAGAVAVALVGTAFPILFSRKDL